MDLAALIDSLSNGAGAVEGVFKALKAAKDLLKPGDNKSADVATAKERLNDALEQMIEIKEARLALLEAAIALRSERAALDQILADRSSFERKASRYALKTIAPNSLAYAPQVKLGGEPSHLLCVTCFDNQKLSILQLKARDFRYDRLRCPVCTNSVQCENGVEPEVVMGTRRKRDFLSNGWEDLT